jgi:AcrR family transcriptional regulator
MRRIAKEIGYTPGTLYLYFKNKDEILFELHNEGFRLLSERRAKEIEAGVYNAVEKLAVGGKNYISFVLENPELYELMFFTRGPKKHIEAYKERAGKEQANEIDYAMKTYENLRQTIIECKDEGYYKDVDPVVAAFFHWSVVHGIVSLTIRDRVPFLKQPTKKLAFAVIDLVIKLVKSSGNNSDSA